MANRAPYRGEVEVYAGEGWAVGVQRRGDDADLARVDGLVVAIHGFLGNCQEVEEQLGVTAVAESSLAPRLAALVKEQGEALFSRLRGEFAGLVLDLDRRSLWLVRDLCGLRPLHLGNGGGTMVVASDPRQVLAGLGRTPQVNPVRLAMWMVQVHVLSEETFFLGVEQVLPGRLHRWSAAPPFRYLGSQEVWRPPEQLQGPGPHPEEAASELRHHLEVAVRRTLPAQPFGVTVSGGLDSSLVWGLTRQVAREGNPRAQLGRPFSLVFPGCSWDESKFIAAVLEATGGEGGVLVDGGKVSFADGMPDLARRADAPLLPSMLLSELVMQAAAQDGRTVLLYGSGGNEWLSGSLVYLQEEVRAGRVGRVIKDLLTLRLASQRARWRLLKKTLAAVRSAPGSKGPSGVQLPPWLAPGLAATVSDQIAEKQGFCGRQRRFSSNRQRLEENLLFRQSGITLAREQVAAVRGTESRHPLCDLDVIGFCWRLPARTFIGGVRPRHLQRLVAAQVLPGNVVRRLDNRFLNPMFEREMAEVLRRLPRRAEDWLLVQLGIVTAAGLDMALDHWYKQGGLSFEATEVVTAEIFVAAYSGNGRVGR